MFLNHCILTIFVGFTASHLASSYCEYYIIVLFYSHVSTFFINLSKASDWEEKGPCVIVPINLKKWPIKVYVEWQKCPNEKFKIIKKKLKKANWQKCFPNTALMSVQISDPYFEAMMYIHRSTSSYSICVHDIDKSFFAFWYLPHTATTTPTRRCWVWASLLEN